MKERFYSLKRILATNCIYNILLGQRSNGKSYAVKEKCLQDAYNTDSEFIYLRRWQVETKTSLVEGYFRDAPVSAITRGVYNCITVYRGCIYFSNYDEETAKTTRGKLCGYVMYLSGEVHFKSTSYPKVENIIYEEFITDAGYLNDEVNKLMSLVSTVARRRIIRVWLIGNSISRICPYFSEWELVKIPKQAQGTIDIYEQLTEETDENGNRVTVRIAVENCEKIAKNTGMFFGAKTNMITAGVWESTPQAHIPKRYKDYRKLYSILLKYQGFQYIIDMLFDNVSRETFLYVYPYTDKGKKPRRIISQEFSTNKLTTPKLVPITTGDKYVLYLLSVNKICFSDNLTGSEFYNIMNNERGIV